MRYLIGIDIGTSNTKAIALTIDGQVIARANTAYAPIVTAPDAHELDPEILFNAVLQTLQQLLAQTNPAELLGISFSSAMHSLIAVDANGHALTHAITWADLRSKEEAAKLKGTPQGKRLYERTGPPIHPMLPLCKLIWMKTHQPAVFAAAAKFIGIKEFILHRLTGQYLVDHSVACGTGLFDIYEVDWNEEALQVAGITHEQLSIPVSTTHIVRELKSEYAIQLAIATNTPLVMGASDGCLANVGSYATRPGDVSVTIGTSGAVRMITGKPQHDPKERIFNYILTDQLYVSGGPINNGGILLKWYAENFLQRSIQSEEDFDWFIREAARVPAGAQGLLFLPYIQGERAPIWDAYAKGVFLGIDTRHTQAHFMRAVVEGINYALYQVAQSVEETVGNMRNIYASGGFIQSPHWLQWMTDLFGREIAITNAVDASATGAAILGLQALGIIQDLTAAQDFLQVQARYYPDPQQHRVYQQYFAVYEPLYGLLRESFSKLEQIRK